MSDCDEPRFTSISKLMGIGSVHAPLLLYKGHGPCGLVTHSGSNTNTEAFYVVVYEYNTL
jgi:hypothetical protein